MIGVFIYFTASREYAMVRLQAAAREAGLGSWVDGADSDPTGDDVVTISPPPYQKGPASRSELQSEDDNRSSPW